ncbi:Efflux pump dotC [Hyphodiscus hymeniophilus]|uniref:Efflux pump dotC n=1 Tax=Hyphodiscus hymeniophilus TaxID=353542 RepID=A0A9P7AU18_9HELO|nr:Efflux pump dotC [Hyphodiscus hymeniophilus]
MVNVITADLVPLEKRAVYLGLVSLAGAFGLCSGALIGGAVSEQTTWRWIFYINLPVCIPTSLAIYFFLHSKTQNKFSLEKVKAFDWMGMIILTGSLIGVLYGVTSGGVLYTWSSAKILSSLIIGSFGIGMTMLYEGFVASAPLIPPRIFQRRTASLGYLTTWCQALVLWAYAYFITLYFVVSKRHSLIGSAVASLPALVMVTFSAALGGVAMTLLGSFKWINTLGAACLTIGFALMSRLDVFSSIAEQAGFQIIAGIGGGILFPGRLMAVQAAQEVGDVTIATAIVSFFTSLGQSFGVAIGDAVFQNRWAVEVEKHALEGFIPPKFIISSREAEQTADIIGKYPVHVQDLYRAIMASTISVVWIVVATFSGVAFIACLASENLPLRKWLTESSDLDESIDMERNKEADN